MKKTRIVRSALPIYMAAAVWLVFGLIFPIYKLGPLLICAALSAAAYFLGLKLFPGRQEEYEAAPDSGDAEVNRQITEGREAMRRLREANVALTDPGITQRLDRMEHAAGKIFEALERNPRQALEVRKFMNYYLPVSVKLLDQYRTLDGTGLGTEHITKSKAAVENSLDMIATAFEKQVDNLYRNTHLDITTDIQVLENRMAAEGLTEAPSPARAGR